MNEGIQYAIPSRARADTLVAKTLPLLFRLGIDPRKIKVFVAPEEVATYEETIDAAHGSHFAPTGGVEVVAGAHGVCANRNAITDHFGEGERYVSIDDDIRDLKVRAGEKALISLAGWEWEDVVDQGFRLCGKTGAHLWGLYPVPNPYFMKTRTRTTLCYVAGALQGIVNRRKQQYVDLEYRDDWQRSVKNYVADGALVRFDYITWKTEGYQGAGGLQTDGKRTHEATRRDCDELVRRYPYLVTLNLTKKSGWPETRLKDRRPVVKADTLRCNTTAR